MRQDTGLFLPDILSGPARYVAGFEQLRNSIVAHVSGYRSVVQAGGHIGIFSRELAKLFKAVYTFEPHAENFACLVRNVQAENVFPMRAFVGDIRGPQELRINSRSTAGHSVGHGNGCVPMLRIDDLGLHNCDLLLLDLEGYEFYALIGAMRTIAISKPVVIVEENKKAHNQGIIPGSLELLLRSRNYKPPTRVGENLVFHQ